MRSRIEEEFYRCAIRLLQGQHKRTGGQQVALVDGLHMVWRPNRGLRVAVQSEAERGYVPIPGQRKNKRQPIWDDEFGGLLADSIAPYYDILRRRFILDELADA